MDLYSLLFGSNGSCLVTLDAPRPLASFPMDRFLSLSLFVAAVDHGSLAAAGRQHGLSAAVAGKHLRALEAGLGVRLMQRSTRRLALTEAGQAFLPRCRQVLQAYDEARQEAADAQAQVSGRLRVAAPAAYAQARLGGVIARLVQAHPALQVDLRLDDRHQDLIAHDIDVALRIGRLDDPGLVVRRLGDCRLVLCAAPATVAALGGAEAGPQALQGLPRLAFSGGVSLGEDDWSLRSPEGQRWRPQGPVCVQADSVPVLAAVAEAQGGLVYGPDFVFEAALSAGRLVRLLPNWQAPVLALQAVFPSARLIPRKVRLFVDAVAAAAGGGAAG